MKASIILPTYKERDNIVELIEAIFTALACGLNFEVVVVDDNSPDGTAEVVRQHFEGDSFARKKSFALGDVEMQGRHGFDRRRNLPVAQCDVLSGYRRYGRKQEKSGESKREFLHERISKLDERLVSLQAYSLTLLICL